MASQEGQKIENCHRKTNRMKKTAIIQTMNTPERWSTASSDSDLSSIFGAGNVFENSQTPVVKSFVVCVAISKRIGSKVTHCQLSVPFIEKFTFKEMADGKD